MNTLLASILDCISPVREIGVTSHRRRDSRVWRRQSPSLPSLLIPNPAPHTSRTSLLGAPSSSPNSVSFFSSESRKFDDHFDVHFVAPETKRFEIYSLFFSGSHLRWKIFAWLYIDSRQCCLSRVRNRFNLSLRVNLSRDLICTIWRRPKSSLRSALLTRKSIPTVLDREKHYLKHPSCQPSRHPTSSLPLLSLRQSVAAMANTDQLSVVKFSFLYV